MAERQPSKLHVASSNLVSRSTAPIAAGASRRGSIAESSRRLRGALARTIRPSPALSADAAALSADYRSGAAPRDVAGHVHDAASAVAYAAARMPATHAACARAMAATADLLSDFAPASLLDVGAGSGASAWAATAVWPTLDTLVLVDRVASATSLGRRLAAESGSTALAAADWRSAALETADLSAADLVVAAYVLGELDETVRPGVVERLWTVTGGLLLLVEPGSKVGFERIRAARSALIAAGGRVVAPCPGDHACPIAGKDWCHFLARLDRSPLQRDAKGAARSWEEEPFSYVAVSRAPARPTARIVLGRPRHRRGRVELRICADGRIERRILSRRDGPAWKVARDLEWGDAVPAQVRAAGSAEGSAEG